MATLRGRSRMSSRGQIVIPKALRDAAGLAEGHQVEVVFDGERLILAPYRLGEGRPSAGETDFLSETQQG